MKLGSIVTGLTAGLAAAELVSKQVQAPLLTDEEYDERKIDLHSPLFKLHRQLVEIESITPNEHEVGQFLVDYFRSHNFAVEAQPVARPDDTYKPRYNIYAYPKHRNVSIILSSHIDTVPPYYPYEVKQASPHASRNPTLHGRGSVDAKASVAAQTIAVLELLSHTQIAPEDAGLLFVVGEEVGGDGMVVAHELGVEPRAVIFGEPTDNKLVSGHKGLTSSLISVKGRAAHSGYPWLGVSANEMLVAVLAALMANNDKFPRTDKYGSTTMNIGKIQGGVAANVVPETASAQVSFRIAGGTVHDVKSTLEGIVANVTKTIIKEAKDRGVDVSGMGANVTYLRGAYSPVDLETDIDGFSDPITVNYGTDVPNWNGTGDRYLYGPGTILVAHSDHEALAASDLTKAVKDYKKMVLGILKKLKRGNGHDDDL